jgi:hypothetical protein
MMMIIMMIIVMAILMMSIIMMLIDVNDYVNRVDDDCLSSIVLMFVV